MIMTTLDKIQEQLAEQQRSIDQIVAERNRQSRPDEGPMRVEVEPVIPNW